MRVAVVKTTDRKSDGSILELRNVISLRYSFYGGWRNVKLLASGECRKIRDWKIQSGLTPCASLD